MGDRVKQTTYMKEYFSSKYKNMPVFIGGDFNEEP